MRHKKDKFTDILRKADAAGLSYGKYVAQQTKRTKRKPIPKDHISINDRKRLNIGMPIFSGKDTLTAAFSQDCPRMAGVIIDVTKPPPKVPKKSKERLAFEKIVIDMYRQGYTIGEIQRTLYRPRDAIVTILYDAGVEFRGRLPLPKAVVINLRLLRSAGYSYPKIAELTGVPEKTVQNYLSCS